MKNEKIERIQEEQKNILDIADVLLTKYGWKLPELNVVASKMGKFYSLMKQLRDEKEVEIKTEKEDVEDKIQRHLNKLSSIGDFMFNNFCLELPELKAAASTIRTFYSFL